MNLVKKSLFFCVDCGASGVAYGYGSWIRVIYHLMLENCVNGL